MSKSDYSDVIKYITENVKLLDVIAKYGLKVTKESDNRHTMVCPFHAEDTASLKIYDNKSFFCFGCGAGYSVIDFMKMHENLNFMEIINRYKNESNTTSGEAILKRIINHTKDDFSLSDYLFSSKYRLGITLREYLRKKSDKEEFVDRCFYDMDNFFEDINNLNREKIDYFEDTILERLADEI